MALWKLNYYYCYFILTFAKYVVFSLFVYLLTELRKNYSTHFHKVW